jgi:hypothetical protein
VATVVLVATVVKVVTVVIVVKAVTVVSMATVATVSLAVSSIVMKLLLRIITIRWQNASLRTSTIVSTKAAISIDRFHALSMSVIRIGKGASSTVRLFS